MPRLPAPSQLRLMFLVLALVVTGCSGSDDPASDQAAAAQVDAAQHLLTSGFRIDSPKFQEKVRPFVRIPKENTCYGENLSPSLEWSEAPEGTQSFALIAEDVDHHTGIWVLWVVYNIPPESTGLAEGISTSTQVLPDGSLQGNNDNKSIGYYGTCPPLNIQSYYHRPSGAVGEPPHRNFFRLYALDGKLDLAPGATKDELLSAIDGRVLAKAETMGKYTTPRITRESVNASEGDPTPTPTP